MFLKFKTMLYYCIMKLCLVENCYNKIWGKGYCKNHQHLRVDKQDQKTPYEKAVEKKKAQNQKSNLNSKIRSLTTSDKNKEIIQSKDVELELWYIHRSKELTGFCANCNGVTTKGDVKYWKYSIAHVMAKSTFGSVKTNVFNFVELCYFGNSCHANFDNNGYEYAREKMPLLWKIIIQRFKIMYPHIRERSKIPDALIQESPLPDND